MRVEKSQRANRIGGLRGGIGGGGGYEQLDPDWDIKRIKRLRAEYLSLTTRHHQDMYLDGLSRADRLAVLKEDE